MGNLLKGNLNMLASKLTYGLDYNCIRYLQPRYVDARGLAALRILWGAFSFWTISIFYEGARQKFTTKQKLSLLSLGCFVFFFYIVVLNLALTYTSPIPVTLIMNIDPVWVFVMSIIFLGEKGTWMKYGGLALGLAGASLCIFFEHSHGQATDPVKGDLFALLASILFSIYIVWSHRALQNAKPMATLKWVFLGAAIPSIIMVCIWGLDMPIWRTGLFSDPMLVLYFVLLCSTTLGYIFFYAAVKYLKATVVAVYGYLNLIITAVASYILKQDVFSWWQVFSFILIVASIYLMEIAERRKPKAPATAQPQAPKPAK
ncbi:MAG: DMT family transporter [Bacteroidales bacterium]|nr:DMT family transporter [Bacteroidales bacterium]